MFGSFLVLPAPGSDITTQCLGSFLVYPAPGSDITTQCLGSFCITQILGQKYPAVGLFIAGILHRLLEESS